MRNTPSRLLLFAIFAMTIASCGTQRRTEAEELYDYYENLDSTATSYEEYAETPEFEDAQESLPLRLSYTLTNDLVHTKLDVKFDWTNELLYGKAWLTFKPHFYSTDSLTLDAKGMLIHKIELVENSNQPLVYSYNDSLQLKIKLDKIYKAGESYTIFIDYTARPALYQGVGSNAITDARGLYFIDPKDTDPDKPKQLWTQGETESNSVWFPTIDKPNAKTTLEISMTVDTGLVTLSNGIMISSKRNNDGTHTDTWKSDKPFAPYLVMMAAGKFSVVKDKWKNIDVNYYVDPEYAPYAKEIFGNTPEMLTYYSKAFGVEYPWQKFSQVVVHDFVSGAMENVSAVVHYDGLHQTHRELIDNNHEDIIAHELSHHWFGDLVTCESWGQIPLNESFATYNEILWMRHKYGNDEADYHAQQDLETYFGEAENKQVPLIRYHYHNEQDMFDAHSYQKGGRILYMLNDLAGDEAYFKSLQHYLTSHQYGTVEIDDLRQSFETVTGRDFQWFFDQWFLHAGHPVVAIQTEYLDSANAVVVQLSQTPSGYSDVPDHWRLPMAIDIYFQNGKKRYNILFDSTAQTFTFPAYEKPLLVNVDANKTLLWNKTESKNIKEYKYQYTHAGKYMDRYEALQKFADQQGLDSIATNGLVATLDDKFWRMREAAVDALDMNDQMTPRVKDKLIRMAKSDTKSLVRASALTKLSETNDTSLTQLFITALQDSSYTVMANALAGLHKLDSKLALTEAKKLMSESNSTVSGAVMYILSESRDSTLHDYFVNRIRSASSGDKFSAITTYGKYLSTLPYTNSITRLDPLYDMAKNESQWFIRYAAINSLFDVRKSWEEETEAIGMELNTLNSDDSRYNELKQRIEHRKQAMEQLDNRISEMKKTETNDLLRSIMND